MNDFQLAPHHQALKTALAPVLVRLREVIDEREAATIPCADMRPEIQWHLDYLYAGIGRITSIVEGALANVALASGQAEEADRAARALLAWIDDWAARLREVQRLYPEPEERDPRDWLASAYRQVLRDLASGLETLVHILEDPVGALRAQGLPTEGVVELPLTVTLTAAPEVKLLQAWIRKRAKPPLPSVRRNRRQGMGFWGWVGAIALGSWIGSSLADDD